MEIRDSEKSFVFFILYICKMKKIMKEKNQVVPDEVLSKEFLSQFKTEADVSKFLKQLHAQVLEKMLEGEMDAHWVMKRILWPVIIVVIHVMAAIQRKSRPNMEKLSFPYPVTVMASLNR